MKARTRGGPLRWRGPLHRLGPLVTLVLGVVGAIAAQQLSLGTLSHPEAGLWPFLVSVALVLSSLALFLVDDADDYEPWFRAGTLQVLGAIASLALFVLMLNALGFLIPAMLLLYLWLRAYGGESPKLAAALAVIGSASFYLLFSEVLGVPFPEGPVSLIFA